MNNGFYPDFSFGDFSRQSEIFEKASPNFSFNMEPDESSVPNFDFNAGSVDTTDESIKELFDEPIGGLYEEVGKEEEEQGEAEEDEEEDDSLDFILDEEVSDTETENIETTPVEKKRKMNLTEIQQYYAMNGGGLNQSNDLDRPTLTNPAVVEKSGKNSYLVFPDLHLWYKNIRARKNYVEEMLGYLKEIFVIIYENENINNIILAGDVFHQSFNLLDNTTVFKNYFYDLKKILNSRGGEIYSVIGNHEYTYNANNLFWHLIDNTIKTPIYIQDNGVKIVLDSYPSKKSTRMFMPYIDGDICITHTEVMPPELKQQIQSETGRRIFTSDRCLGFDRFRVKHLFVGHLHKNVDRYIVNAEDIGGRNYRMHVQYLGSLGRTAVDEIDNDFLDRDLPLITITGNGEYEVSQFTIRLKDFETSTVQTEVERNQVIYEKKKEFENLKLERVTEKPIQAIKDKYQNELINQMLDAAKSYQQPEAYNYIIAKLNKAYSDFR